jgi:hypothetical protein
MPSLASGIFPRSLLCGLAAEVFWRGSRSRYQVSGFSFQSCASAGLSNSLSVSLRKECVSAGRPLDCGASLHWTAGRLSPRDSLVVPPAEVALSIAIRLLDLLPQAHIRRDFFRRLYTRLFHDRLHAFRVCIVIEFFPCRPPQRISLGTFHIWVGLEHSNRCNRNHPLQDGHQNQSVHGKPRLKKNHCFMRNLWAHCFRRYRLALPPEIQRTL